MGKSTWRAGEAAAKIEAHNTHYRAAFERKWGHRAASLYFWREAPLGETARESQIGKLISRHEYRELIEACLSLDKPEIVTQLRAGESALSGESKRA